MSNRDLIKSYSSEGTIAPCRIVKPGANDYGVAVAAAAADKLIGVTMPLISVVSGDTVEIMHDGICDLQLGGTVTRGDQLTSDASGQGITATASAGSNVRVIGIAIVSGVSGDIIPVLLSPGSFQG
jgi:endonuclease YncB( thermonuclease family)